ncbi:hypothetical protein CS062_02590 [Roseateles chitinivorans]|uniref:Uncharacterized protein n=1 Tax=Roseateles chitinivorans TaxID=2917965 RepID=A0A2G9CEP7_9BURK|nr:hypothetical protein CS062_02590 [Roseateles chitinivorans]
MRVRSEHAQSIDVDMRAQLAQRLIEEHGDAQGAADALWTLAPAGRRSGATARLRPSARWVSPALTAD